MATLDQMTFSIKVKNIREIKRATKAIEKLSVALSKAHEAAMKANAATKELKNNLPILVEIEMKETKAPAFLKQKIDIKGEED